MNVSKLDEDYVLNVNINFTRRFRVRMFVAKALITAAAWVLGCGIKIEQENSNS